MSGLITCITRQDLIELFQELDENKDGLVTFEEFLNGLRVFQDHFNSEQEQGLLQEEFADRGGGGGGVASGRRSVTNFSPFPSEYHVWALTSAPFQVSTTCGH